MDGVERIVLDVLRRHPLSLLSRVNERKDTGWFYERIAIQGVSVRQRAPRTLRCTFVYITNTAGDIYIYIYGVSARLNGIVALLLLIVFAFYRLVEAFLFFRLFSYIANIDDFESVGMFLRIEVENNVIRIAWPRSISVPFYRVSVMLITGIFDQLFYLG